MNHSHKTAKEVYAMSTVIVETVYRLIADDELPTTRVGRSLRLEADAVQA